MQIDFLPWDSEFFGIKVGSINRACPHSAWNPSPTMQDFDLVYLNFRCESNKCELSAVSHTFDAGTKLTFTLALTQSGQYKVVDVAPLQQASPELENLALLSGHKSRFKLDPGIPDEKFKQLYRQWLVNCLTSNSKTTVLGHHTQERLSGFITVEHQEDLHYRIGLIAVGKEHQGRGIGQVLINGAISTAIEMGGRKLTVQTQGDNHPAIRAYLNAGFELTERCRQLHWWNPKQSSG